jgi:hypothetical protein
MVGVLVSLAGNKFLLLLYPKKFNVYLTSIFLAYCVDPDSYIVSSYINLWRRLEDRKGTVLLEYSTPWSPSTAGNSSLLPA